jgi:hypothetical protein
MGKLRKSVKKRNYKKKKLGKKIQRTKKEEEKRKLLKICNIMNLHGEMFQRRNHKIINKQTNIIYSSNENSYSNISFISTFNHV